MSDRAISCARAVAEGGPQATTGECTTRELAQRVSGAIEVLLLWHPEGNWVELAICDLAAGVSCQVEVAPDSALDAFYHPYAYAADACIEDGATIDG